MASSATIAHGEDGDGDDEYIALFRACWDYGVAFVPRATAQSSHAPRDFPWRVEVRSHPMDDTRQNCFVHHTWRATHEHPSACNSIAAAVVAAMHGKRGLFLDQHAPRLNALFHPEEGHAAHVVPRAMVCHADEFVMPDVVDEPTTIYDIAPSAELDALAVCLRSFVWPARGPHAVPPDLAGMVRVYKNNRATTQLIEALTAFNAYVWSGRRFLPPTLLQTQPIGVVRQPAVDPAALHIFDRAGQLAAVGCRDEAFYGAMCLVQALCIPAFSSLGQSASTVRGVAPLACARHREEWCVFYRLSASPATALVLQWVLPVLAPVLRLAFAWDAPTDSLLVRRPFDAHWRYEMDTGTLVAPQTSALVYGQCVMVHTDRPPATAPRSTPPRDAPLDALVAVPGAGGTMADALRQRVPGHDTTDAVLRAYAPELVFLLLWGWVPLPRLKPPIEDAAGGLDDPLELLRDAGAAQPPLALHAEWIPPSTHRAPPGPPLPLWRALEHAAPAVRNVLSAAMRVVYNAVELSEAQSLQGHALHTPARDGTGTESCYATVEAHRVQRRSAALQDATRVTVLCSPVAAAATPAALLWAACACTTAMVGCIEHCGVLTGAPRQPSVFWPWHVSDVWHTPGASCSALQTTVSAQRAPCANVARVICAWRANGADDAAVFARGAATAREVLHEQTGHSLHALGCVSECVADLLPPWQRRVWRAMLCLAQRVPHIAMWKSLHTQPGDLRIVMYTAVGATALRVGTPALRLWVDTQPGASADTAPRDEDGDARAAVARLAPTPLQHLRALRATVEMAMRACRGAPPASITDDWEEEAAVGAAAAAVAAAAAAVPPGPRRVVVDLTRDDDDERRRRRHAATQALTATRLGFAPMATGTVRVPARTAAFAALRRPLSTEVEAILLRFVRFTVHLRHTVAARVDAFAAFSPAEDVEQFARLMAQMEDKAASIERDGYIDGVVETEAMNLETQTWAEQYRAQCEAYIFDESGPDEPPDWPWTRPVSATALAYLASLLLRQSPVPADGPELGRIDKRTRRVAGVWIVLWLRYWLPLRRERAQAVLETPDAIERAADAAYWILVETKLLTDVTLGDEYLADAASLLTSLREAGSYRTTTPATAAAAAAAAAAAPARQPRRQ